MSRSRPAVVDLRAVNSLTHGRAYVPVHLPAFLLLLLIATNASSQSTAQINGTVADSSGAVLPGATVVATQTETGFRRDAVSDDRGSFTLSNLPIGPYRLEVTLSGFRAYVQTGIVLQVNSNPVFSATLQLGDLEETVTVVGATRSSRSATLPSGRSSTTRGSRRCRSRGAIPRRSSRSQVPRRTRALPPAAA